MRGGVGSDACESGVVLSRCAQAIESSYVGIVTDKKMRETERARGYSYDGELALTHLPRF